MSETATPEREAERYPQIVRAIRDTPWAMLESAFATMVDVVGRRLGGERLSEAEIRARVGDRDSSRSSQLAGSVAVIPIYGAIIPKATLFSEMSGGTSIQGLQASLREALADDAVKAIVFDIDSPGGMTDGVPELAAEIRAARGQKPMVAVANYRAASAAYWLGAQADEFAASQSADVGSVGVFAAHESIAGLQEKTGVQTTLISQPAGKVAGNPFEELTPEARAQIQERVDEMYEAFTGDLAKGRGVTAATVKSDYGQGKMLSATKALEAGMIDRIDTLEAVVARLQNPSGRARVHRTTVSITGDTTTLGTASGTGTAGITDAPEASDDEARPFISDVNEALRAFEAVVSRAEALRALTGTKRDQLAALMERGKALLATPEAADPADDDDSLDLEHAYVTARLGR